jgi:hypothetical protein
MLLDSPVIHRNQSNQGTLMVVLTFEVTTPSELLKVPGHAKDRRYFWD